MPTVTAESTPPSALLERRLGSTLWNQIKPYLDAAQAADAADAAQLEYVAAARATASANCRAREALVQQAIDDSRAILEATPRHDRVNKIWQHLTNKKDSHGYQFKELPTRKVVKRVLKANSL